MMRSSCASLSAAAEKIWHRSRQHCNAEHASELATTHLDDVLIF
jgi:hypothetical protein